LLVSIVVVDVVSIVVVVTVTTVGEPILATDRLMLEKEGIVFSSFVKAAVMFAVGKALTLFSIVVAVFSGTVTE
jgi:hypothetical protein